MTGQAHPYKQYERTTIYKTLDKAVEDLVRNGDLVEQTARPYIVGYLTKLLMDQRLSSAKRDAVRKKMAQLGHELAEVDLLEH